MEINGCKKISNLVIIENVRGTGESVFSGREITMSDYEIITVILMVLGLVIAAGDSQKRK